MQQVGWVIITKQRDKHTHTKTHQQPPRLSGFWSEDKNGPIMKEGGMEGNNTAVSLCDFSESPSIPRGSLVGTASPEIVFSLGEIRERLTFPVDLLLDCDTVSFLCVILTMCVCVCLIHFGCARGRER